MSKKKIYTVVSFLCIFFGQFLVKQNIDIDNYLIGNIVNGQYTDNAYCIFIHPILNWICQRLHRLIPSLEWFSIILVLGCSVSIISITILLFGLFKAKYAVFLDILIKIYLFYITIFFQNYTVIAAFTMSIGGALLLFSFSEKFGIKSYIVGNFLAALGLMIRKQGAFLVIPYIMLAIGYLVVSESIKWSRDRTGKRLQVDWTCFKRSLIRYTKKFYVLFGIGLVLVISSVAFYQQHGDSSYIKYNELRTIILDYPGRIPSWEEIKAEDAKLTISENDYWMLRSFNIADPQVFTTDVLEEVVSLQKPVELSIHHIKQCIVKIFNDCKSMYFIIIVLSFFLLLYGKNGQRVAVILCGLGTFSILFYFTILNRCPIRVNVSVAIPALCTVLFIMSRAQNSSRKHRWKEMGLLLLAAVYMVIIVDKKDFSSIRFFSIAQEDTNDDWKDTYSGKEFYLWNVYDYDAAVESTYGWRRELNSNLFLQHNNSLGEWHEGSTYLKDYRERLNISNPMQSLWNRDDVYLIYNDMPERILLFIQEHYDTDATISKVGEINKNSVFRIMKGRIPDPITEIEMNWGIDGFEENNTIADKEAIPVTYYMPASEHANWYQINGSFDTKSSYSKAFLQITDDTTKEIRQYEVATNENSNSFESQIYLDWVNEGDVLTANLIFKSGDKYYKSKDTIRLWEF